MSVIIKGMKMPKSCDSCDLIQFDDEGLEAHCPLSPYYRWCGTPPDYRPEGCRLERIPAPHGRLIDADEIEKCVHEWYDVGEYVFADTIRNADTIIETEVSE